MTHRSNNIRNVRDTGSRCSTKVQDFASRWHMNLVHATQDSSGQLGTEGIPNAVLNLALVLFFDSNSLFAIDTFSGNHVQGNKSVFLATSDKHAFVTMRLNDDSFGSASAATTTASSWSTATSRCSTATTSTAASAASKAATTRGAATPTTKASSSTSASAAAWCESY